MTLQPVHRHLGHQILGLLDDTAAMSGQTYRTPTGTASTVLVGAGPPAGRLSGPARPLPPRAFLGGLVFAAVLAFPYRPDAPLDLLSGYWWRWRAYPRAYGLTRDDLDRLTRDYGGPAPEALQRDLLASARAALGIYGALEELGRLLADQASFALDGTTLRNALGGLLTGDLPPLPPDPEAGTLAHAPPYLNLKPAVRKLTHAA